MPTHSYESNDFVWGRGCISELRGRVEQAGASNALVVCGENVSANEPLRTAVEEALGEHHAGTFTGVRGDTPLRTVHEGVEAKREHGADALVSVGGGAASDTAKAIATFDAEGSNLHEMKARTEEDGSAVVPDLPAPKAPIFAVATTLSAAEVSNAFGVTDETAGEKSVVVDEKIRPAADFYDAELTSTTPASVIASTGMNALDHAVEILYSDPRGENPFYQATTERAISLLVENLPDAVGEEPDLEAIQAAQIGAALSALGLIGGICINHGINHALCARHPVSHGNGNSILLPHGIRFNYEAVPGRVERIAEAFGIDTDELEGEAIVDETIAVIRDLQTRIDVPTRLRDVGVDRDDFEAMASIAVADSAMSSNPRTVTTDDIVNLLEDAW